MFISKTCYDEILNHYRNCGPCSRVWQTRIIDLSSYLPYRCFIDETKPDESIDVRKNLSIFFFCGIFDAREDTAVRVSSRRTVVPNYLNSLVHGQVKLTSWNGEETRKCLSGSVSRFDSLKVEHIGKSSNYFYNCRHFMGFTADWHCE